MNIFERNNGFIVKLYSLLQDSFPMVDVEGASLRNCIYSISKQQKDKEKLIKYLESLKEDNKVEHIPYGFTESDSFIICNVVFCWFETVGTNV